VNGKIAGFYGFFINENGMLELDNFFSIHMISEKGWVKNYGMLVVIQPETWEKTNLLSGVILMPKNFT
jgi:hypothetical protein